MTTTTLEYHPENHLSASPAHGLPGTNFLYSSPLSSPEAFTLSLPVPRPRTRSLHAGYVWSSAILLADRLATGEVDVKGKRIVELGCGLALPGIVAAQMGAEQVVLTDYDNPTMLADTSQAVQQALSPQLQQRVQVVGHTWGTSVGPVLEACPSPDLILVADCVWERELHRALIQSLLAILRTAPSCVVHFAAGFHTGRSAVAAFLRHALASGLAPVDMAEWQEKSVTGQTKRWDWTLSGSKGLVKEERQEERNRWTLYGTLALQLESKL
ncbi:RHTO0S28e00232g1_1 [Rhodotorula toruloides]|uniref:RHTO0S28e00232g1_1 n=1 Tax=Rhodotorula toruloides TaxID=5286 RepID=A0A061BR85_RHOTO|nr:RHTO0S28e00232g1_1 [Rhodotorula toruloides]